MFFSLIRSQGSLAYFSWRLVMRVLSRSDPNIPCLDKINGLNQDIRSLRWPFYYVLNVCTFL